MMNLDDATARAQAILSDISEETGTEMEFFDGRYGIETVQETATAYLFRWNSKEYLESDDFMLMQMVGPLVVPKDGSDPWMMGTYTDDFEQQLEDYENRRGPYRHRAAQESGASN